MIFALSNIKVEAAQTSNLTSNSEDSVYNLVEKMPDFPGGDKAVIQFLNQNMIYPAEAQKKNEQGRVIVQFVISKTGKVETAKVLRGVSKSLDNEALRVINLLPNWTPGEQNGQKVAVLKVMPIVFKNTVVSEADAWTITDKTLIVIDSIAMPSNFNTNILNPSKLISATILKPFPKEEKTRLINLYGKNAANGVILITSNKDEIYYAMTDSTDCKEDANKPEFVGGNAKLFSYIADSIQYPFVAKQLKTQGKVIVRFKVDKTGKVTDSKVVKTLDYFLDKEALRVINTLPNWIPGTQCDKKVDIIVTMPVIFKLELPTTEVKEWKPNEKTVIMLDGVRLPSSFDLAWLNYANLVSYKVIQPGSTETNKKLIKQYGKDAVNGVVLIGTVKDVK
jgi:TonB family protein